MTTNSNMKKSTCDILRKTLFYFILFLVFTNQNANAQCNFISPPAIKKVNYANREVTFTNVTMNGQATTYLSVNKGETVKITANIESSKNGNYCPSCIVQVYWGIRGYTSVCAESFYGFRFKRKKTSHKFQAPKEDGIYYITMGGTLDYSCKNNIYRPSCSPNDAFAVLKVGNPDPEKKLTLVKANKGTYQTLKTSVDKSGCFGDLDKIEWFLDDEKLSYDDQKEIPLSQPGTYKVVWSNCLDDISKSFTHNSTNNEPVKLTFGQGLTLTTTKTEEKTNIAELIERSEKFILKNLIFDLRRWEINAEAKKDLDQLARVMKESPSMKILLEGHTDKRGNSKQNQILSEKRVKSTKDYLVKQGVNGSNIETKGWGDKQPLIVTTDIEKGKINRRVEVRILTR